MTPKFCFYYLWSFRSFGALYNTYYTLAYLRDLHTLYGTMSWSRGWQAGLCRSTFRVFTDFTALL